MLKCRFAINFLVFNGFDIGEVIQDGPFDIIFDKKIKFKLSMVVDLT